MDLAKFRPEVGAAFIGEMTGALTAMSQVEREAFMRWFVSARSQ